MEKLAKADPSVVVFDSRLATYADMAEAARTGPKTKAHQFLQVYHYLKLKGGEFGVKARAGKRSSRCQGVAIVFQFGWCNATP